MKIFICDDEKLYVEEITEMINGLIGNHEKISIKGLSDERQIKNEAKINNYDVAFLDIEIGHINGLEIAKDLLKTNPLCMIIFITNYTQYVSDAFSLNAFQYLYKPIEKEKFEKVFYKIVSRYRNLQIIYKFNTSIGKKYLSAHDVVYLETYYTDFTIVTTKHRLKSNIKNLKEYREFLSDFDFIKTHQSYFVNLEYVKSVNRDTLTLYNDKELPISISRRKDILKAFHRYLLRRSFNDDDND